MPASITVSRLAWSTPDGRAVLSNLDLSFGRERTGLVGRNGIGKSTLLKLIAGDLPLQSGDVSTAGRLGVLRQSVQADARQTVADLFGANEALALLRRAELGDADADGLARADWTLETRMAAALDRLGLDAAPGTLLLTLSGGQRTRIGLAALVFAEPDFILLDEPTNNLDRDGRRAVIELLTSWRGGAIVVSHDRELLETLDAIVELTGLGATRYGGNFTHYCERKALELAAAEHDLADAERRVDDIAERAQATAERKARKDRAGQKKTRPRRHPAHPAQHAAQSQRGHRGQECAPGRAPARAGPRRCREGAPAHRGAATPDRRRSADRAAVNEVRAQDRRSKRGLRPSPGDSRSHLCHHGS